MARRTQPKIDKAVLEMAVVGYQHELDKLSARMAEIRTQLAQPAITPVPNGDYLHRPEPESRQLRRLVGPHTRRRKANRRKLGP